MPHGGKLSIAVGLALVCSPLIAGACHKAPHFDAPESGVRATPSGRLQEQKRARDVNFLGCDMRYANLPAHSHITIRWLYFERDARLPSRKTQDEVFNLEGSGVVSAFLAPSEVTFPKGTYACEFRPSDEFDVSPLSAQIELTTD
jgi:hypothetical protein